MSLHQFFLDSQVLADETGETVRLRLDDDDMRHARVLRLEPGEHIAVIDAASDYFECEIVSVEDGITVRIAAREEGGEDGPTVILLQGLAKGDKMEEVIRHATEIGVSAFVPLKCARSVVKLDEKRAEARTKRWRSVAQSAAKQSGRRIVPEVSEPTSIAKACELISSAHAVLICWEEAPASCSLREAVSAGLAYWQVVSANDARVAVIVGPEGGLEKSEVEILLACNPCARLVTLGRSILRTETAGVVAPALALYELGGLGNAAASQEL